MQIPNNCNNAWNNNLSSSTTACLSLFSTFASSSSWRGHSARSAPELADTPACVVEGRSWVPGGGKRAIWGPNWHVHFHPWNTYLWHLFYCRTRRHCPFISPLLFLPRDTDAGDVGSVLSVDAGRTSLLKYLNPLLWKHFCTNICL